MKKNEVAAQIMEHLCNHDGDGGHGYSQYAREGSGGTETLEIGGEYYTIATGDRDCSSAVCSAYQAAGVPVKDYGATYTGNMKRAFLATGQFEWKPMSFTAQRGDVYLNEVHHTAMCTSVIPDMLAQFSISENGTIHGQTGDQTGQESNIRPYYDYPWDGILHYIGDGEASGGQSSVPSSTLPEIGYYAMTAKGWHPRMIGWSDTGGSSDTWAGNGELPILYLAIEMPEGSWYQVQTDNGWLDKVWKCDTSDLVNGAAGDGTPIRRVRCWYETPNPSATGYHQIEYSVANVGEGFLPNMIDLTDTGGSSDDFAGNGGTIGRFRARLVS